MKLRKSTKTCETTRLQISSAIDPGTIMPELLPAAKKFGNRFFSAISMTICTSNQVPAIIRDNALLPSIKSWPGFNQTEVRKITRVACKE
jgi:hypothetical protein